MSWSIFLPFNFLILRTWWKLEDFAACPISIIIKSNIHTFFRSSAPTFWNRKKGEQVVELRKLSMKNVNPIPTSINTYHNHPTEWKLKKKFSKCLRLPLKRVNGKNNECHGAMKSSLFDNNFSLNGISIFSQLPIVPSSHHLVAYLHSRDSKKISLRTFWGLECWKYDRGSRQSGGQEATQKKWTKNCHLATLLLLWR